MFRKLYQQNVTNKSPAGLSEPRLASKSPARREASYSGLLRKRHNNSEIFDYEVARLPDHLFQGCLVNNRAQGEGIMVLDTGITIVGNWHQGLLNGYALCVTPFGGKVHASFVGGRLEGWVILQYNSSFEILNFVDSMSEPVRWRYDATQQLWTEALYKNNKLEKVLKIEKTRNLQLPSFIKDLKLKRIYQKLVIKQSHMLSLTKICNKKIGDKFQYFGYLSTEESPQGLGIIYSHNEIYAGHFKQGALDGDGVILFENGLIYRGQIYSGKIWGTGAIYDYAIDETKFVNVSQDGVESVLKTIQGCCLANVQFKVGTQIKNAWEKGFTPVLNNLCNQVTKYVYRAGSSNTFIDLNEEPREGEQAGVSSFIKIDQMNSHSKSRNQFIQRAYPSGRNRENGLSLTKSKNKGEGFSRSKGNQILLNISNQSRQYNLRPAKKQIEDKPAPDQEKKNLDLDDFSIEQIRQIPCKSFLNTPSRGGLEDFLRTHRKKTVFSHLLQFQLEKVKVPTRSSNAGKIVVNSHLQRAL